MNWTDIGSLDMIPLRGARLVKTHDGCVAVFRTADAEIFATNGTCVHKGGPLAEGIVHGRKVTCPMHNWTYSLETGKAMGADEGQIRTYPARIDQGRILIDMTGPQPHGLA